jgi:hypothetical protein
VHSVDDVRRAAMKGVDAVVVQGAPSYLVIPDPHAEYRACRN